MRTVVPAKASQEMSSFKPAARNGKWAYETLLGSGNLRWEMDKDDCAEDLKEEVVGPIAKGLAKLRESPDKLLGIIYQTDMTGWKEEEQKYKLIKRQPDVRVHFETGKSEDFTFVQASYLALKHHKDIQAIFRRDAHTDQMTFRKQKLEAHHPGRLQGLCDMSGIKLLLGTHYTFVLEKHVPHPISTTARVLGPLIPLDLHLACRHLGWAKSIPMTSARGRWATAGFCRPSLPCRSSPGPFLEKKLLQVLFIGIILVLVASNKWGGCLGGRHCVGLRVLR